jgi:fucose 4-O-acetylase-like acetyltransferase
MTLTLVCFTIIEKMVFQNCKTFWNIIILCITNLHKSILQLECKIVKVTIEFFLGR